LKRRVARAVAFDRATPTEYPQRKRAANRSED
jgi:hypothetical protein